MASAPTPEIPLELVEVEVRRTARPPVILGTVRNNSDAPVAATRVSLNVTNARGMLLGSVSAVVRDVPPRGTAVFRVEAPLEGAANALLRDMRPD